LDSLVADLLNATRRVTGPGELPLHEPLFGELESKLIQETIASTMVSSVGPQISEFEDMIKRFTGSQFAVATVNGTTALQVALLSCGLERGDEVLVPSLTFAATASAVVHAGGTPVFMDSDPERIGLDPHTVRSWLESNTKVTKKGTINSTTGNRIHSIIPVHIFGHPVDIDAFTQVSIDFGLEIVEDAAESLGSYYKEKHTGTFGTVGIISFNGNKTITTGGGGVVLTDNEEIALSARHKITTAKIAHPWEYIHDGIGFNFRLPNLNAALGVAQMHNLMKVVDLQRRLFEKYAAELDEIRGIRLLSEPSDSRSNYWLQAVILDKTMVHLRDEILEEFNKDGLKVRPAWRPLHLLTPYSGFQRSSMSGTEEIYSRLVNLPSSPRIAQGSD
jgi:perosamine synthetase